MRSIFILRNNNKHQNHLSDDEFNTEKTCFPERFAVITKRHKLMSHKNSPGSTSSYECEHRPGLLVKSCTETTGLAHAGVQPPRPHIKLCAQCERLPLKGVTPSSSLHDQIASGRREHETPHRQMYRSDFRDNSATVGSIYRLFLTPDASPGSRSCLFMSAEIKEGLFNQNCPFIFKETSNLNFAFLTPSELICFQCVWSFYFSGL